MPCFQERTPAVPIYEYECNACGKIFEVFLNAADKPVKKCAHCKSTRIHKLISNCSFQLKGSGWYVTDYAKRDKKSGGNGKQKETAADTTAAAAKTDAKASSGASDSAAEKKPAAETKAA